MKKILGYTGLVAYFGVCFWHYFTLTAQAYIDPSVATYLIQAIAGALIALGAVFTIFRHKIMALFKGKKKNDAAADDVIELKDVDENEE
ncbi:MAG: hypothetical protein IJ326_06540 [Lachnospiraceae bacterium]|nr:hypothetical protein [Lachnospiraceae bacterium]